MLLLLQLLLQKTLACQCLQLALAAGAAPSSPGSLGQLVLPLQPSLCRRTPCPPPPPPQALLMSRQWQPLQQQLLLLPQLLVLPQLLLLLPPRQWRLPLQSLAVLHLKCGRIAASPCGLWSVWSHQWQHQLLLLLLLLLP